ncbi:unnamed protein product [Anisakis simplex]|uniref:Tafazzin family protein n=1 Tax=Anisakis simplex TaxID=6269 RepID=A0A0M3K761_ANISI|nr:unnamed protein product [Anisakis simplex]
MASHKKLKQLLAIVSLSDFSVMVLLRQLNYGLILSSCLKYFQFPLRTLTRRYHHFTNKVKFSNERFISLQMGGISTTDGFKFAWPFPRKPSLLYKIKSRAVMIMVETFAKSLFALNLNRITVINRERLIRLVVDRTRPLITVANHRCMIDDPLVWALFSWREFFANLSRCRYTLTAHNICFTKAWHTTLFSLGRCVPVVRGAGVRQKGVDFCIEKLADNNWVHVFPEGKVTPHPIRIKWGVARLVGYPSVVLSEFSFSCLSVIHVCLFVL